MIIKFEDIVSTERFVDRIQELHNYRSKWMQSAVLRNLAEQSRSVSDLHKSISTAIR